jgi:hypothetical protein
MSQNRIVINTAAQLVEALVYNPAGRVFDFDGIIGFFDIILPVARWH